MVRNSTDIIEKRLYDMHWLFAGHPAAGQQRTYMHLINV
jgi:hypothetical protein